MSNNSHGMTETSEYSAWKNIKSRCLNSDHKHYSNYGGRGIKICDRWKNSFENFFTDMGKKPTSKHSIDRIDNNSDYCPENCKWSTRVQQENNKRTNKPLITIGNETRTIAQWTTKMGFEESVIYNRLKLGWSEYDAVMTPVETGKLITIGNETRAIAQWTTKMGFNRTLIQSRLRLGWSEYKAVMTPVRPYKIEKKLSRIC